MGLRLSINHYRSRLKTIKSTSVQTPRHHPNQCENDVIFAEALEANVARRSRYFTSPAQQKLIIDHLGAVSLCMGRRALRGPDMLPLLYVWPEPLDSDDTILSNTSRLAGEDFPISINLRKLQEWGLIRKIDLPSSRKSLYTARAGTSGQCGKYHPGCGSAQSPLSRNCWMSLLRTLPWRRTLFPAKHGRNPDSSSPSEQHRNGAGTPPPLTSPEARTNRQIVSTWQRRQRDGNSV